MSLNDKYFSLDFLILYVILYNMKTRELKYVNSSEYLTAEEAATILGIIVRVTLKAITGEPQRKHISTSFIERQNLTMRMQMRRFTRLTNAFSKSLRHLEAALALHFFHYNFMRIHETLRVTPAMQAGISRHLMTWEEFLGFEKRQKLVA